MLAQSLAGILPIAVLLGLVLWGRWPTSINGLLAVATAIVAAHLSFGAPVRTIAVGLGKGVWIGLWILLVIWAALLLHHLTKVVGMDRIGPYLRGFLPYRVENVLLVAWIFASMVQGISGFGVPVALTAPLLVAMGLRPVLAIALPLIGFHWAIGFGSMGSSFYVAALTAHLTPDGIHEFAVAGSRLLTVNMLAAGVLVAWLLEGRAGVWRARHVLLVCGSAMAVTLNVVAHVAPSIASVSAGSVGFVAAILLRVVRRRSTPVADRPATEGDAPEPGRNQALRLLPFGVLIALALAINLPPAWRAWTRSHLLVGPSFPPTSTSAGYHTARADDYTPIALLGHPATYLLVALLVSLLVWKLCAFWPRGQARPVLVGWLTQSRKSSMSVISLTALAGLTAESGMATAVAEAAVRTFDTAFPVGTPLIGALGAFLTGSSTSSNALFGALQAQAASLLDIPPASLLAGQLAGANVGNLIAPVTLTIGAVALNDRALVAPVLRRTALAALVLVALTVAGTVALVYL